MGPTVALKVYSLMKVPAEPSRSKSFIWAVMVKSLVQRPQARGQASRTGDRSFPRV